MSDSTAIVQLSWGKPGTKSRAASAAQIADHEVLADLLLHYTTRRGPLRKPEAVPVRVISPSTVENYRRGVKRWCAYIRDTRESLLGANDDDLRGWCWQMLEDGCKPATVKLYACTAVRLARALKWAGVNTPRLEAPKVVDSRPVGARRVAPEQDATAAAIERLLAQGSPYHANVRLAVGLAACGGLRASEIANLQWGNVDLDAGRMAVLGKGNRVRLVGIRPDLAGVMRRHIPAGCRPEWPVLRHPQSKDMSRGITRASVWNYCREWQEGEGLTGDRGPHALRHYFGTRIYRATGDAKLTQSALGHSSITTTMSRYVKSQDDEDVADAVAALD